jgi:hypothetical protein
MNRMKKKIAKPEPTKAELRVQVAKDVLRHLATGKIKPSYCGQYMAVYGATNVNAMRDLRRILKQPEANCSVCALGALFVAEVIRRNDFLTQSSDSELLMGSSDEMRGRLERVFTRRQLLQVERAYEGYGCPGNVLAELGNASVNNAWSEEWLGDEQRLEAIMRSIIRNDGAFHSKPSKADRNPQNQGNADE